ncbi:MAG TPA: site-specific integrase [bacterium]|nr:site-specific integrase [bacterium]HQL64146.1 site-specific integrase [bacterium]
MTWKLTKRGKGWYARNQSGGRQRWKKIDAGGKRDAEQMVHLMNEREQKVRYGGSRFDPGAVPTIAEVLPAYLGHSQARHAWKSHTSIEGYIRKHFAPLLQRRMNEIGKGDIQDWQNGLLRSGLKRATVNRIVSILSCVYTFAIDHDMIDAQWKPYIKRLKEDRPPIRWFRDDEVRALFEVAPQLGDDVALFVHLGIQAGLRLMEILSLRYIDIDRTHGQIIISQHEDDGFKPKSRQERRIPVHPDLWPYLNKIQCGRYFPPGPKGIPQGNQYRVKFDGPWNDLMRCAGIEVHASPHAMRHTFGTWLARNGCSAFEIQQLMGHSSVAVSERYIHLVGGPGLRRAIETLTIPALPEPKKIVEK